MRLVGVRAVGDERLGDGDRGRPGRRRDHLRVPGERRDRGKAGFLAQEGDQLQLRVQPGLEAPVRLEQDRLADDHRRVRLVGAERPLRERRDRRDGTREPASCQHRRRAADQHRADRPRSGPRGPRTGSASRIPRDRRDRPSLGNRSQQGPPRPVLARFRPAATGARSARTCTAAPTRRPARSTRDRQHVTGRRVQHERILELDRRGPSDPWRRTSARRDAVRDRALASAASTAARLGRRLRRQC